MRSIRTLLAALLLAPSPFVFSQGTIYLVLGSDTAIWDAMDVSRHDCTYALSLYTDPTANAARVMDPAFRLPLRDSYGTPVKLTWWMMAGNIFRYATNTNVPTPNTMTLYLMKKYQGESIRSWGDELTLHYHTFVWTDYDGDGKYYWNQARSFLESSDDFDVTLATMLLEDETFPVSFRSGWHAMDNSWQQRLDMLLPYSMHNDWPAKRQDPTEPLDNVYDWSRSPSVFVPFHPSPTDYQVPGPGRGWNVRSKYMSGADSAFMNTIFRVAATGRNQVVCLWAHLPEVDFLDNVRKVDSSAHKVAPNYPDVRFRYCTAIEAMQLWRRTADTVRPQLTLKEIREGTQVRWRVSSSEPLFQTTPFIAAKDKYGEYRVLPCNAVGDLVWQTSVALPITDLAKVGVAATDTAGNLETAFIRYLPDDIFIDNTDPGYAERSGSWISASTASWGTSSRLATLGESDSAKAEWRTTISVSTMYDVFVQIPQATNPAQQVDFRLLEEGQVIFSKMFTTGVPANRWVHIGTKSLSAGTQYSVEMVAHGSTPAGRQVASDVVKFSPLVRDKWLVVPEAFDVGEVIVQEQYTRQFTISNEGIDPVVLTGVTSAKGILVLKNPLPMSILPMEEARLEFDISAPVVGILSDTLVIASDDPHHSLVQRPVRGNVLHYFAIIDDRDSLSYVETGTWNFSNARAYGTTSRYAVPAPGVSAAFSVKPKKGGVYRIEEIVPTTVNASERARYLLSINGLRADSVFVDQNSGSGNWVPVMEHTIRARDQAVLQISDAMSPVIPGRVLRADAVRFQWIRDETTGIESGKGELPTTYSLRPNYPNPFNPSTTIMYELPTESYVSLKVYDLLGREVAVLVDERKAAGRHTVKFDTGLTPGRASGFASGMYLYRLNANDFVQTRTLLLLK